MKFLPIFFLFSLSSLVIPLAKDNVEDFTFELTVNSEAADPAQFEMVITGYSLSEDGSQIPYKLKENDLETPYKLILKNGEYTAEIRNKSKGVMIHSKVQGVRNGERGGYGSSDSNQSTLQFGVGGNMSVKDN